jgi:hypothetical protein
LNTVTAAKACFFETSLTIRILKPLRCNGILLGKSPLNPLQNVHGTRQRKKNMRRRGKKDIFLNNEAPDLKLNHTIAVLIPGSPDGED